jgi:hypothetical protein
MATALMSEWTQADGLAFLDSLLDSARINLALHPDHFLPTLFISVADKIEIVGLGDGMPESRIERRAALMAVGRRYARDAEWVAYVADAWVKHHPPGVVLPPKIDGHPEAREALVSMWLSRGGQFASKQVPYTREPSDGRSAERVVFHEPETTTLSSLDYDAVCATVLRGGGWRGAQA